MPQAVVSTTLVLRAHQPPGRVGSRRSRTGDARPVCGAADFGVDGMPPAPFALLVADALDSTMTPGEWRVWTAPDAAPRLRAGLLEIWRAKVWPRFISRFGLWP